MMLKMNVHAGPILEKYNRQRRNLAEALYRVETAHARLGRLKPADGQYGHRLQELATALNEYWRVDEQIETFLMRTGG